MGDCGDYHHRRFFRHLSQAGQTTLDLVIISQGLRAAIVKIGRGRRDVTDARSAVQSDERRAIYVIWTSRL